MHTFHIADCLTAVFTLTALGIPLSDVHGTENQTVPKQEQSCSTNVECDDAEPCTIDTCNQSSGVCENARVPGVMFATGGGGGNLYEIDQSTGAASLIGYTGVQAPALAVDPTSSVVYAGSGGADDLYTVDTVTAASYRIGSSGLGAWALEGLDFDAGGTLYASVNTIGLANPGGDKLAVLDKFTGAGTIVGSFGVTDIKGIAVDGSGTLYGASGGGGAPTLYTIDPATGAASAVGPIVDGGGSPPSAGVASLQFDLEGTLYAGTNAGDLLEIDPPTAVFTPVGSSGASALGGLAVRDECPDPCQPPLTMYSMSWGKFFEVNTVTGRARLIAFNDFFAPSLAVDPITGVFYAGAGGGFEDIHTLDPITAGMTLVGSAGFGFFALAGLDFDSEGTLYSSMNTVGPGRRGGDTLVILDKNTGAGTIVGSFGIPDIGSIAFSASGTLYGSSGGISGPQSLYTIDPATAELTLVGELVDPAGIAPRHSVPGIESDLAGFLYGVTSRDLVGGGRVIRIDPTTGVFNVVGTVEVTVKGLGNLAFHQTCRPACKSPSTLFASDGSAGNLYEIDQVLGTTTLLGSMGIPAPSLAVDPTTGLLYAGTDSGLDQLYRIDPVTAVATPAGSTGLGLWSIAGMDFDAGGTLYASANTLGSGNPGGDSLAILDKTTGAGTIVGSFGGGIRDLGGLVFSDSGTLYGATGMSGGAPTLYTIDLSTGAATALGTIDDPAGVPAAGGVSGFELDLGGVHYGSLDNGDLIRVRAAGTKFSVVASPGASSALHGLAFLDDCPKSCATDAHCDDGNPCTAESCDLALGECTTSLLPDSETAAGVDGTCGTADDNSALYGVDATCGTADDGAGDGLCDAVDRCAAVYDPGNPDADDDGAGDACDCDPLDDGVWTFPGEIIDLHVEHSGGLGGTTTLTWSPPASPGGTSAVVYDTLRSDTADTFASPYGTCVEFDDGSDQVCTESIDPSPIFYYVVRAENGCGSGTIGAHSNGTPRVARVCP